MSYIQTDGNDVQPHATQTINESTSAGSNPVTAQSTACAPWRWSNRYTETWRGNLTKMSLTSIF